MGSFHPLRDLSLYRVRVKTAGLCVLVGLWLIPAGVVAQVGAAPDGGAADAASPDASPADSTASDSAPTQSTPPPLSPEAAAEAERAIESGAPYREDPIVLGPHDVEGPTDEGGAASGEPETRAAEQETAAPAPADAKRVRFTGFPFAFYLPETSVGFGFGIGVSTLTRPPREGSSDRWFPSNLTIGGAYTVRRQLRLILTPELYLRRGKLVIDGLTEVRLYPDRFYGLGRDTDVRFQRYTDVSFRTSTSFRYQAVGGVYVGAVLDAAWTQVRDVSDVDSAGNAMPSEPSNGWLGTGAVPGENGSHVLGVGPTLVVDRRDFPLMSRSGFYVRLVGVGFPKGGPLTNRFFRTLIDIRGYIPLAGGNAVFGAQWVFAGVHGVAPFNHLASVGGPLGLRSYPDGRFRDAAQTFTQLELRFPIVWRIRGALSAGTGAVFGPASQGRPFQPLWAVGIGLRAVVLEDRRVAVRGDLVYGPEGVRVLAYVHEAF